MTIPVIPQGATADAGDDTFRIDGEVEDVHNQLPKEIPERQKHPQFRHYVPPHPAGDHDFSVFLAGSIEMGRAILWQKRMSYHLQDLPIGIYNPRRGDWKKESSKNGRAQALRTQVLWEMGALDKASVICIFLDHTTLSPITLCELGLYASSGKVVVCCHEDFHRSGNVHMVCEKYKIPLTQNFAELELLIRAMLRKKGMMLDSNGDLTKDPARADYSKLQDPSILDKCIVQPPVFQDDFN